MRSNYSITSDSYIEYSKNQWILQLHNELKLVTGKLLIPTIPSGTYLQANDVYLMDAWDAEGLSLATLQKLNYCRIYLKVNRLSDIVTNDGQHIQVGYLNGRKVNQASIHEWP